MTISTMAIARRIRTPISSTPRDGGVDLDELGLVTESHHAEQRRRRHVAIEPRGHAFPRGEHGRSVTNDVDGELMHVARLEAVIAHQYEQVRETLFGLGSCVADADEIPIGVVRNLTGDEQA